MNAETKVNKLNHRTVNKALRPLGVKVVAGKGYFYFLDLVSGYQVGKSVMVYRLYSQTVDEWTKAAAHAIAEQTKGGETV